MSRGGYRAVTPHVRLFVQNEGPPKCLYRYDGPPHEGANPTFMSPNQLKWFRHAKRWWLVRCESAEAGRRCIHYWEASKTDHYEDMGFPSAYGLVLASGVKP